MGDAEVTASSWRQVEQGRIAFFANGPFINRVAAIVQIIDHKRVRDHRAGVGDMKIWAPWTYISTGPCRGSVR